MLICWLSFSILTLSYAQNTDPNHQNEQSVTESPKDILFLTGSWDSKYISEGRDNLDSGGLASITAKWSSHFAPQDMFFTGWYAEGTDTSYTELNLGLDYGIDLEKAALTFGYTWLTYDDDYANDNEISTKISASVSEFVDITGAFVYSTEAGGIWVKFIASTEMERNEFTIAPYAFLGINCGYIPDEHDGLNNLQFGIDISYPLNEKVSLGGYLAHTIALDDDPYEALDDTFWLGVYLGFGN